MRKELLIYTILTLMSGLLFHPDLLTEPLQRLSLMYERSNYYHPFLFGLGVYLLVAIPRLLYFAVQKLMKRSK